MTSVSESRMRELIWQYPEQVDQPFVLRDEGREVGWLQFQEEPEASTAEFGGRKWSFHYSAGLRLRVTVRSEDSKRVVAEYVPCLTGGGSVSFQSGTRYRWRKADVSGTRWCFRQDSPFGGDFINEKIVGFLNQNVSGDYGAGV